MLNYCFELHLYWSVKSLPEDLFCQRDPLCHVFPERRRKRKSLSSEKPFYIFAPIYSHKWRCFVFSPQDQSVQLCLSLPASPLVPERKHKQAQNLMGQKKALVVRLLCVSPTSGPGAPIPPGVPDLPWKTQRDGCDEDLKRTAQTINQNENHNLWGS